MADPHSLQNRDPARFAVPQDGHTAASGAPQPLQNLLPPGFSVPQAEQVMVTGYSSRRTLPHRPSNR